MLGSVDVDHRELIGDPEDAVGQRFGIPVGDRSTLDCRLQVTNGIGDQLALTPAHQLRECIIGAGELEQASQVRIACHPQCPGPYSLLDPLDRIIYVADGLHLGST